MLMAMRPGRRQRSHWSLRIAGVAPVRMVAMRAHSPLVLYETAALTVHVPRQRRVSTAIERAPAATQRRQINVMSVRPSTARHNQFSMTLVCGT